MKIGFGGIMHESNTFSPVSMTLERFRECGVHFDSAIIERWKGTNTEFGGIIEAAEKHGLELVPSVTTWGMPSGPVEDSAFEHLIAELLKRLMSPGLDGIVLCQHGAMVTQSRLSADADTVRQVREAVGPRIPIVTTLDFHANISQELVDLSNVIIGYNTYPHTDYAERGREAVETLLRILQGELCPVQVLSKPPILPNVMRQATGCHPMKTLMGAAFKMEANPKVVNVTVAAGFPYADVPHAGMGIVAVTNGCRNVAKEIVCQLEDLALSLVEDFDVRLIGPAEAVSRAIAAPRGPVVLADVGDNIGGGTPGDGTVLLEELIRQKAKGVLVVLADAEAVRYCLDSGIRSKIKLAVGAKTDQWHGSPIFVEGTVRLISDGVFVNKGPMRDGIREDQGCTVVLECNGITLVLTEFKMPMWNLQQLRSLGIDPADLKIIVNKSAIAFRAAYEPIAAEIIEVDTPGLTAADLSIFPYKHFRVIRGKKHEVLK